ncbi:MAG: hypothetical protein HC846_09015 [Blastocatellia bacterium]|nr:hypothetical protein [Blastocatellia bacterium]
MTIDKLWKLTLILLILSLITGRFAIFTNGGNGNSVWYLLLWLFCTSLFYTASLLLAEVIKLPRNQAIILAGVFTLLGFISSSAIGLMSIIGLPVLILFTLFVVCLLIMVKAKSSSL